MTLRSVEPQLFVARGADVAEPLTWQPWGSDTVTVRDADRNLLLFAAPTD